MNKVIKRIVPLLLVLVVLASICWYFFVYDRDFTQNLLLNFARGAEARGNYRAATWYYDLAYRHSNEDELVAIELAERFKENGNYTKAEYTLSSAIADGGGAELYIALCKTYIEQDKLRDAVAMLDNVADPAIKAELDAQRPNPPESSHKDGYYNEYINVTLTSESGKVYVSTEKEDYPSTKNEPLTEALKLEGGETVIYALTIGDNGLVSPLRVLGYTIAGVIEEVTITDTALDSIIREKLDMSNGHTLYTNQLWNITSLEINCEVKDLAELSKMSFLEYLTIQQGDYKNLSALSALTHLKTLTIDGVTFTSEEFHVIASLPNLQSLSMVRCNLSDIAGLSNATRLKYLDLSNNTIRDLSPLSSLAELEHLNLSHNAVTQLTALSGATKLKELDISFNSVSSTVALSGCKSLETLRCDYNALTNFEGLEKIAGLAILYANHNQISDISHLANASKLTELDISNNALSDISVLAGIKTIRILKFENNQVTALPSFSKDCSLSTINGARNRLTDLEALYELQQLNYVVMDHNSGITSVNPLSSCSALIEVSVYQTGVTDVSALTQLNIIVKYAPV